MASPDLALSRFTNLDQEFAPEYPNPLTGSASENNAVGSAFQPLPISIPHDTVTPSKPSSEPEPFRSLGTSAAPSLSSAATYSKVPTKEKTSAVSTVRNSENSQSSNTGSAKSTASSTPKAPPEPEAAPRETEAPQEDSYQTTTQQSLLQLDRTLQQIGVDPQHTSLVRRVALVRLANDPPALGEYFGPPSAVAASISSSPAQTNSPAPEPTTTDEVSKASTDPPHRHFVSQGKLLDVTA
jgi:hypothetical protein